MSKTDRMSLKRIFLRKRLSKYLVL